MSKGKILKRFRKKKSSNGGIRKTAIKLLGSRVKEDSAPNYLPAPILKKGISKTGNDYTDFVLSKAKILDSISQSGNDATLLEELLVLTALSKSILAEQVFEISTDLFNQYIDNVKVLPTALKERIIKIIELYKLGIELFESAKEFNSWLGDSSYEFSKTTPYLNLLKTSIGIDLIYEELKRIEFGATA